MARKMTYIYKVIMSKNGVDSRTDYCYARNAGYAVDGFKEKYAAEKYDGFKAVAFGEADMKYHKGLFEIMPQDEVEIVKKNNLGNAAAYSNRADCRNESPGMQLGLNLMQEALQ